MVQTARLVLIGYWKDPHKPSRWPSAHDFVDFDWDEEERDFVAHYLMAGLVARAYMGYSTCRICGRQDNGNLELSDGTYVWPNGLAHYIIEHGVRLPPWFVAHAFKTTERLETADRDVEQWSATSISPDNDASSDGGRICEQDVDPSSKTSSIEEAVRSFESELSELRVRAKTCVDRLRSASSSDLMYPIAERLPTLGSIVIPELIITMKDSNTSADLRYLAAWVAVSVGDREHSIEILCAEVAKDSNWSLAAANTLARHNIVDGRKFVAVALSRVDPADDVKIIGYMTALRDLGATLTDDERDRLFGRSSPWIAEYIDKDFPPG